jgi:xylulokinase
VWPAEVIGEVHERAAAQTGLPRGLPVMGGTVDAWAEAVSSGVRAPGDLMLMYGSTMFMVHVVRRAEPIEGLWTTVGVDPGSWSYAAGMATSGAVIEWYARLTEADSASLARDAASVPAGANGLVVLPFFSGERSPLFDPHLRGTIAGLTLAHGRSEIARAIYEGIAYGVRHNLETMESAAGKPKRIVAVGGGTQAQVWMEIVSGVTQLVQNVPRETIGAAYGDALLAAEGIGLVSAGTDWSCVVDKIEPDPTLSDVYDRLFADYLGLHLAVAPSSHRLAAFGEHEFEGNAE